MWGVLAVSGPHWVCPCSQRVCFPGLHCSGSRLLSWELSKAGPGLRALPRSKPLKFRFLGTPQRHRLGWACVLCPSQVRAAQATRCLESALSTGAIHLIISRVPADSFLGAQRECRCPRCAICLLWWADLWLRPSWQMSTIQDPRKICSLVGDVVSGAKFALCLPDLVARRPPCLWWGWAGLQPASSPLVFAQSFILWVVLTVPSVQFSSVAQSCPTLCDPMNCSTPGLPVHHHLLEFTQIHVHRVGDAIQPSHPLSSPSPPAPNPSQHQSLFQWVNSSHEIARTLRGLNPGFPPTSFSTTRVLKDTTGQITQSR